MIEIKDEDIVVMVCASKKVPHPRLYKCSRRNIPCFCVRSEENTKKNTCFYIDPNGEIKDSSCSCTHIGKPILFVADPNANDAPKHKYECVTPDTPPIDTGNENDTTWRALIKKYNNKYRNKPHTDLINNLCKAHELYKKETYSELRKKLKERFYILSAGWGLIPADYLLPNYNITFNSKKKYNKISMDDIKIDLYENSKESISKLEGKTIHFFGGKRYHKIFYKLSNAICTERGITRYLWYWKEDKDSPKKPMLDRKTIENSVLCKGINIHASGNSWYYTCVQNVVNKECNSEKCVECGSNENGES